MESFSTGQKGKIVPRVEARDAREVLGTLCQCHIPGSPPDIGRPLVVAVFDVDNGKRRVLVERVVHAKRDRGVIEPCVPSTWIVLRGRDRYDVLILAIFHIRLLTHVPSITWNLPSNRLLEIKRVVNDQIKRRPFTDFARGAIVPVLPNVVNDETSIESAEIVKHACIPAVSRERTKSRSYDAAEKINAGVNWDRLRYKESQVVAIEREREYSEVTAAKDRGIQLIGSLVIEAFCDKPDLVLRATIYVQDRAGNGIALNQV